MIAESTYPLVAGDSLVKWRDTLSEVLEMKATPVHSMTLAYCDSFDWRLYRAGLRLDRLQSADGVVLRLVRLDDQRVEAEQTVESDTLRFAETLPEGPLRQRLEALLEMRAFLPLAIMKVRSYGLHKLDSEGKTRARLYIESFALVGDAGRSKVLSKQLRLQPLRGYEKAAKRIAATLGKRYKQRAAAPDHFRQALAAAGKEPGDYSSKLKLRLKPGMRADAAARVILRELFEAMQVNEQGTIEDIDSEFLHDFRVAVRRTRSLLGELKPVFPPATLKRYREAFAWLGGLTSSVRDLDVYLLKFDRYQATLPQELREGLEPLRGFLRYKQQAEQSGHLAKTLQGKRYTTLKAQWGRYLDTPLPKRPTARDAGKSILEVAGQRTWRMYKRVMREGEAITDESPPEDLHELRKSCKKLRYLMEFFQSLYPTKAIRALIRELKQLQDNLGDFQDLDVQIQALERFSMEMRRRGEYSAATGESMSALLEALKQEMAVVRADFHTRFELFAAKPNRLRFKALFNPDKGAGAV